jgi:hypothetical protein
MAFSCLIKSVIAKKCKPRNEGCPLCFYSCRYCFQDFFSRSIDSLTGINLFAISGTISGITRLYPFKIGSAILSQRGFNFFRISRTISGYVNCPYWRNYGVHISRAVRVKADTCKSSLIFNEDTCKFPRGQLYS